MVESEKRKARSSGSHVESWKFQRGKRGISQSPLSTKHVPQRTCVACRKVKAKRELIRLVRVADGRVEVDTTGKRAGRGIYLCWSRECWQLALKGNKLEHALRGSLTPDNREQLLRYGEELDKQ